jgi:RNA polymerase sigma-70 factor (ECF subfamily)
MAATRRGDREAFGFLVDRHKDALVSYLSRLVRCADRAQDLAQEAFLRLYSTAHRYDERGHWKALLYRIATNLVRSELRRERRFRLLVPFLDPGHGGGSAAPAPMDRLLAVETQRQLAEALAALPFEYRAPIVLHEIEGWSYADIARAIGCREGTVKSRIHRGRERLRRRLTPYWKPAPALERPLTGNGEVV